MTKDNSFKKFGLKKENNGVVFEKDLSSRGFLYFQRLKIIEHF